MIDQQQFKSLEQLILAFIFNPKLSGQVIHVLIDLIKNDKLPSSLKQVIEHIFYKNVIKIVISCSLYSKNARKVVIVCVFSAINCEKS